MKKIIILGAGIAGLAAAWKLREFGLQSVIYESEECVGGLLRSFSVEGFTFDKAVHLSFTEDALVRKQFDTVPYLTHPSNPVCFDSGRWVNYPIHNNLFSYPAEFKTQAIIDFLERPGAQEPLQTYQDWLRASYGNTLAATFPEVYTRKYWTIPASELTTSWVGQRMHTPDVREVLLGAMSPETPNVYYAKAMRYPEHGGFRSFLTPIVDASQAVMLGHHVKALDTYQRIAYFENGSSVSYDYCISTIPLPELAILCSNSSSRAKDCASNMHATSVDIVSVGFEGALSKKNLWLYVYDEDILAARIHNPCAKSPNNAPQGCSSLQFEVYSSAYTQGYEREVLLRNVQHSLRKMHVTNPVLFMDHRKLPYGNVIFTQGMEESRAIIKDEMQANGIVLAGRFGEWDYLWSDQSMLSGVRAATDVFNTINAG